MLSTGAFNALLKTLEEPPEHVIFILATTEAHKVPQTILSRCQRFDFKRIKPSDIIVRMKEIATGDNLNITDEAYVLLARLADGSLRDGLTILERCISSYGNSLTVDDITNILGIATNEMVFKLTEYIINSDTVGILKSVDMLLSDGRDLHTFIDSVIKHMRDLMVCRVSDSPEELLDYSAEELVNIKAQSGRISFEKISNCITILTNAKTDAKWIKNPRVVYELALIKITKPELDDSTDALLDRIGNMEDQIKKGITVKAQRQEEAPIIEEKPKKEKKVSERLFVPIDRTTLTTSSPVVLAAKKWDKFVQNIGKKQPFLLAAVSNRSVTIDGEGLIMLFDKSETMTKQIAKTYIRTIEENFNSFCGGSFRIKEAFKEDVEDVIIDFWNLPDGDSKKKEKPKVDKDENDSPKEDLIHQTDKDPIDVLAEKFPEIVEFTDDSEFINYSTEDNKFSQTNMDGSDENDSEEFLETHEKEDEE